MATGGVTTDRLTGGVSLVFPVETTVAPGGIFIRTLPRAPSAKETLSNAMKPPATVAPTMAPTSMPSDHARGSGN